MDAQGAIIASRIVRVGEMRKEVARLKEENARLRDEAAALSAHFAFALLAARDLETLPKGSRFIIVDGWNMVLGDGSDPRRAKSSRELVAKWQAYLASRTGDFVWIVFDGHDDNTRQDGRLRVSYTGGTGAQRADRFICDFLRMARFQGLAHRVEVVTSDKKLLKEAERLIKK